MTKKNNPDLCETDEGAEIPENEFFDAEERDIPEPEDLDFAEPPEEVYEPQGRYDATLYKVYKDETVSKILQILSYVSVALTVYAYGYNIVVQIPSSPLTAVRYVAVCAVPFILVSIMRKLFDAPRPYETYPFYKKPPKSKRGEGFPSRHVFSIFVIAATLAFDNLVLGIGLALLGGILAVCRILLGMHFIRDTVAGAAIGIVTGVLGMLISGAIIG